jgi:ABC-type Fe3+/spermidine/putrescine transport system ATPase subunit
MGGWNLFAGKIVAIENGFALIEGGGGERYRVAAGAHRSGEQVDFGIRRDRVHLAAKEGASNAVSGQVHAIEYQGNWVKVTLTRPSGARLVAVIEDQEFFGRPAKVGDQVNATFAPEAAHFMAKGTGSQSMIGEPV